MGNAYPARITPMVVTPNHKTSRILYTQLSAWSAIRNSNINIIFLRICVLIVTLIIQCPAGHQDTVRCVVKKYPQMVYLLSAQQPVLSVRTYMLRAMFGKIQLKFQYFTLFCRCLQISTVVFRE